MFNAARLRRLAPLAILITVTSLLTACSADMTGPSAKRHSGYITTSGSIEASPTTPTTGSGTSKPDSSTNAPVTTPTTKKSGKGNKALSGYNVPAL